MDRTCPDGKRHFPARAYHGHQFRCSRKDGDVMGSCVFNLAIIALMHGPLAIFFKADQGHILSAGYSLILIGIAVVSLLICDLVPSLGQMGFYTPALIAVYGIGIRSVYLFEKKKIAKFVDKVAQAAHYDGITAREALVKYCLNAVVLVLAVAIYLKHLFDPRADAEVTLIRQTL